MADITIDPIRVAPVGTVEQHTAPSGEAFEAGSMIHLDSTSLVWVKANATNAAGSAGRIACALSKSNRAGDPITGVYRGNVDLGAAALDGLAPEATLYLSNTAGKMADTAGTVSKPIGTVTTGYATPGQVDRLVRMNG